MPSPFRQALIAAEPAFDVHMGDRVRFVPMLAGDFGATPDGTRAAFEVSALVNYQDPSAADIGKMNARVPYEETTVEVQRSLLAGRVIRKDDQVILLDEEGEPTLKVSRIEGNDPTRRLFVLAKIGA